MNWNFYQNMDELRQIAGKYQLAHKGTLDEVVARLNQIEGAKWMLFYPELAQRELDEHRGTNRNPKQKTIPAYEQDMKAGGWKFNPEPITFLESGFVGNGQHRLETIVRSGMACFLPVVRNVPNDVMEVMDTGVQRSTADVLRISGYDINSMHVGVMKAMVTGIRTGEARKLTAREIRELIESHRAGIDAAINGAPRQFRHAPVHAVIARAYYNAELMNINRFKTGLFQGTVREDESAVTALRTYLSSAKGRGSGQAPRSVIYAFTETCMDHFLRGEPLVLSNPRVIPDSCLSPRELFPVPDEEKLEVLASGLTALESRKRARAVARRKAKS